MKIAHTIVRILMGLLFVMSSVVYFLDLIPEPELEGSMLVFNQGLKASVYLLPLLKVTELVTGLALIAGRFVALANVILAPVILNILFVHIFLAPDGLPIAIFLTLGSIFIAYYNWEKYKPLFQLK